MSRFQIELLAGAVDEALELVVGYPFKGRHAWRVLARDLHKCKVGQVVEEVLILGASLLALGLLEEQNLCSCSILHELWVDWLFAFFVRSLALWVMRLLMACDLEVEEAIVASLQTHSFRDVGMTLAEISNRGAREELGEILQANVKDSVVLVRVVDLLFDMRSPLA